MVLSNGVSTSQFADAVANCGTDPLAREVIFSEVSILLNRYDFFANSIFKKRSEMPLEPRLLRGVL